jgi:ribosomal protein S18 acetylase RimI-like enzyme
MIFRPMLEADADAVRKVDVLAFTPLMEKTGAPRTAAGDFPLRTRENILAARAIFPQGCFVADPAQTGRELAGYIFARVWGAVGWVGVFGVHPGFQGQQVGQQLLSRSVAALQNAGCTTIGLETIPDSYYNIGLYARQGFRPITMSFALQKSVQPGAAAAASAEPCHVLQPGDERGLNEVSRISQAAWLGLDLRAEALNAMQYAWGQPVLVGSGAAHTIAIARTAARRENQPYPLYEVTALAGAASRAVAPLNAAALPEARLPRAGAANRPQLAEIAHSLEAFAAQQGFTHLRLNLNSADWQSLQVLLAQGYRIAHSALRLILAGAYGEHPGLEFSRWAM